MIVKIKSSRCITLCTVGAMMVIQPSLATGIDPGAAIRMVTLASALRMQCCAGSRLMRRRLVIKNASAPAGTSYKRGSKRRGKGQNPSRGHQRKGRSDSQSVRPYNSRKDNRNRTNRSGTTSRKLERIKELPQNGDNGVIQEATKGWKPMKSIGARLAFLFGLLTAAGVAFKPHSTGQVDMNLPDVVEITDDGSGMGNGSYFAARNGTNVEAIIEDLGLDNGNTTTGTVVEESLSDTHDIVSPADTTATGCKPCDEATNTPPPKPTTPPKSKCVYESYVPDSSYGYRYNCNGWNIDIRTRNCPVGGEELFEWFRGRYQVLWYHLSTDPAVRERQIEFETLWQLNQVDFWTPGCQYQLNIYRGPKVHDYEEHAKGQAEYLEFYDEHKGLMTLQKGE